MVVLRQLDIMLILAQPLLYLDSRRSGTGILSWEVVCASPAQLENAKVFSAEVSTVLPTCQAF